MTTTLRLTHQRGYRIGPTHLRLLEYVADPWYDDPELLAGLITDEHYPDQDELPVPTRHGPYGIEAIDVASFVPVTAEMAHGVLLDWSQGPAELRERLEEVVVSILRAAVLYHLPALRNRVRHSSAEIDDITRFDEIVAIDRPLGRLNVVALAGR